MPGIIQRSVWVLAVLAMGWGAPAGAGVPSIYSLFKTSLRKLEKPNQFPADYTVAIVAPTALLGSLEPLNLTPEELAALQTDSDQIRDIAFQFLQKRLQEQGFPPDSTPAPLATEYRSVLEDSLVVIVFGADGEPLGVVSMSYDFGNGTAGERRLVDRLEGFSGFARDPVEERFIDGVFRTGLGLAEYVPHSLLLSLRKFRTGGQRCVAELKTLELAADLQAQAEALAVPPSAVKMHVLALLQHALSSHATFYSAEPIPESEQIIIPTEAEFEARLEELRPTIEALFPRGAGDPSRDFFLAHARRIAFDPPPQKFTVLNQVVIEVGGLDSATGTDIGLAKEKMFRYFFQFTPSSSPQADPDVPLMSIRMMESERSRFERGSFLRRRTPYLVAPPQGFDFLKGAPSVSIHNPSKVDCAHILVGGLGFAHTASFQLTKGIDWKIENKVETLADGSQRLTYGVSQPKK